MFDGIFSVHKLPVAPHTMSGDHLLDLVVTHGIHGTGQLFSAHFASVSLVSRAARDACRHLMLARACRAVAAHSSDRGDVVGRMQMAVANRILAAEYVKPGYMRERERTEVSQYILAITRAYAQGILLRGVGNAPPGSAVDIYRTIRRIRDLSRAPRPARTSDVDALRKMMERVMRSCAVMIRLSDAHTVLIHLCPSTIQPTERRPAVQLPGGGKMHVIFLDITGQSHRSCSQFRAEIEHRMSWHQGATICHGAYQVIMHMPDMNMPTATPGTRSIESTICLGTLGGLLFPHDYTEYPTDRLETVKLMRVPTGIERIGQGIRLSASMFRPVNAPHAPDRVAKLAHGFAPLFTLDLCPSSRGGVVMRALYNVRRNHRDVHRMLHAALIASFGSL